MIQKCWLLIIAVITSTALSHMHSKQHKHECLIIVLVDGVRWDYMNEQDLPGFENIAKNGVKAEYVIPIYPSNSYPNWYTIVTGRYAESHGFVQNFMYSKQYNDYFLMSPHPNASHAHWWNYTEPLWITAEKNHIKTGMYWWDGCQVEIDSIKVTSCKQYLPYELWNVFKKNQTHDAIQEILDTCRADDRKLALIYLEAVDAMGHEYGPDSKERKEALKEVDTLINELYHNIEKRNMQNKVNLIIVSDHGMADSNSSTVNFIDIQKAVNIEDIEMMLDRGSMSMIEPVIDKLDKVYNDFKEAKLPGLNVYKKEDIPDHYNFKNHNLVLSILLVADQGYFIKGIPDSKKMKPSGNKEFMGFHGYDPYVEGKTDMRTIFYAYGPSFKTNYISPAIQMVDHYNLFSYILEFDGLSNNGSWERVKNMLNNGNHFDTIKYSTLLIVLSHLILLSFGCSLIIT